MVGEAPFGGPFPRLHPQRWWTVSVVGCSVWCMDTNFTRWGWRDRVGSPAFIPARTPHKYDTTAEIRFLRQKVARLDRYAAAASDPASSADLQGQADQARAELAEMQEHDGPHLNGVTA